MLSHRGVSDVQLGSRMLRQGERPYIIAEIGVNHAGSMERARELIELAKAGGADAAKFQSYKASSLASRHSPAYWDTSKEPTLNQRDLFAKYDAFGADEYRALAAHCRSVGIDFISTPFDNDAVEFLTPLVPFFKVASADLTNIPLLRRVGRSGKPVVLSTGASTLGEVDDAIAVLRAAGSGGIVLLHCVLNYPTPNALAHLRMIEGLRRAYPDLPIGYSDHTLPDDAMTSLITATLLGSVVLEKHFTHDKRLPGNDHYHAMDVDDLRRLRVLLDRIQELLGPTDHKAPLQSEAIARANARRSIVVSKAVGAGEILTEEVLTTKRPGFGISPLQWDDVVGRKAIHALEEDHILEWSDVGGRA